MDYNEAMQIKLNESYTNCSQVTIEEREEYMKDKEEFEYSYAVELIELQLPELYQSLSLDLHNFWEDSTFITDNHLIITHSAMEYFIPYTS